MPLTLGARVGPYEVTGTLGAGGREVYRARDTRLKREVALKILPAIFAADPERLARFEREAQLLASLNHPHIGGIHGLEESEGLRALVLELVEGETLAERIAAQGEGRSEGRPLQQSGVVSGFSRTGFLMIKDAGSDQSAAPQIVVVKNWLEDLKRLVPTN